MSAQESGCIMEIYGICMFTNYIIKGEKVMKNLVLAILAVVVVFGAAAIGYSVGYKQSTKDGQEPMENEIRLVQEHTATAVADMFFNIPEVREILNERNAEIYSVEIPWWNFDRQYEIVRFDKNIYHEQWWDLAR